MLIDYFIYLLNYIFMLMFTVAVMILEFIGFDPMGSDKISIFPYLLIWTGLGCIISLVLIFAVHMVKFIFRFRIFQKHA